MLTNLTSIKFSICKGWKCHMPLLKYMLGNAEVLNRLQKFKQN
ncbi:hypothetical protein HanPI659440_Chr06g0235251 [Helianthus annuus]|nr:hypothetical protein HanPI659440_Chr06g0235251 [Helianthus annuus]